MHQRGWRSRYTQCWLKISRNTSYILHYPTGYQRWWTGFGGWYPPPPFSPDCGQHRPHCRDHLLLLTDTNPSVIFQVQQGFPTCLPESWLTGSGAEPPPASCPQSALTQLRMHCQLDSPWAYITTPLFRRLERQFSLPLPHMFFFVVFFCLSSASVYRALGYCGAVFVFFLPQRLQSLQLLKRRRWAGWRSCMQARQWCKKRERLIKPHTRKLIC